jgi:hypothetical protein
MKRLVSSIAAALLLVVTTGATTAEFQQPARHYSGELFDRESRDLDVMLRGGVTYTYDGSCDSNRRDLDFALYEWMSPSGQRRGYWRFVAANRQSDDTPSVRFRPGSQRMYRLSIIMSACNASACDYDVDLDW